MIIFLNLNNPEGGEKIQNKLNSKIKEGQALILE
jgi:hypothetical protein